ncbi:DUF6191 domain-containing protein [Cellulomonas aerilata]|uniref:Uncharacterized protein n=1 Tax=Cellulomonas aerilata TaxID=515326 RepID=A0A512D9L1_9CELL|nr:DUF6191 domain-containing protein [Cellulomonas aerilata]GEO33149.1 hypothetical protein CAE01nite_08740 [Cellulomonas aerilata]
MGWWRRSTDPRGGGAGGVLGDLLEVFGPSRRHVVEEQERRRHDIQLPGTAAPPGSGVDVDLDAGVAHLHVPPTDGCAADGRPTEG